MDRMFSSTLALFTLVAPFAFGLADNSTSANNTQLGIEAIEANFQNADLVPALISTFDPVAIFNVSFGKVEDVSPGQNLTMDQVKSAPILDVIPANSTILLNETYTLAMVDADIVGTKETSQTRHWLVNNVAVTNGTIDFKSAKNITDYAGPAPPSGSGPHRYVILLYTQLANFTPPANLSSTTPVGTFDFPAYVNSTGLRGPVAGFYFQVEQGVATVSLSSTAAVVTSTLPAATQTVSSAKPTQSGAASPIINRTTASLGLVGLLVSLFL